MLIVLQYVIIPLMEELILKKGREHKVDRHPWIYSGAVQSVSGEPVPGDTVTVKNSNGEFFAYAAYSPDSSIRARVWTRDPGEDIVNDFFRRRIKAAIKYRKKFWDVDDRDSLRLVHGEADGLPGLIVDKYTVFLVIQFLSAGVELWKDVIIDLLQKELKPMVIYERSDTEARIMEGLPPRTGIILGEEFDDYPIVHERKLKFMADIKEGQKTGFFLDQRDNRELVRNYSSGARVLDVYCYTGGFALSALKGRAKEVVAVDSSESALEMLRKNLSLNGLWEKKLTTIKGNAPETLRSFRDSREEFDLIILDPPKFAPNFAALESASRAYKDINLLALKLLKPGGHLFTFSCSGAMSREYFHDVISYAAQDAEADAVVTANLSQTPDHPMPFHYPEAEYLKGFIIIKR